MSSSRPLAGRRGTTHGTTRNHETSVRPIAKHHNVNSKHGNRHGQRDENHDRNGDGEHKRK